MKNLKNGTVIWDNTFIHKTARIGSHCIIGRNVYIDKDVVVGDNCKIQDSASLFRGVVLEDGVFVGPHVCFTNDKQPRAITPDGKRVEYGDWELERTLVERGASIGANSTILPGVTIGHWAMVGAGSVVTTDVRPYNIVGGNPTRLINIISEL